MDFHRITAWHDGHMGGSATDNGSTGVLLKFGSLPYYYTYSDTEYGSPVGAMTAALAEQRRLSDKYGLTRNEIREVTDTRTDITYIEMRLTQGFTALIDVSEYPRIRHLTWHA